MKEKWLLQGSLRPKLRIITEQQIFSPDPVSEVEYLM